MNSSKEMQPFMQAVGIIALTFCFGLFSRILMESFPNFVSPLATEFLWDRATIAFIYSVASLSNGFSGPVIGFLFDRAGPRFVYLSGLVAGGSGFAAMYLATEIWHFYIGMGLTVGFCSACLGNVPNSALMSRWFREKLPLVLSIVYSSFGAGIFFGLTISQILITELGWRHANLWMGGSVLLLVPLIIILPWKLLATGNTSLHGSKSSIQASASPDVTLRQALKDPHFWGLFSVFFFTATGTFSIVIQAVTYLIEKGFDPIEASVNFGFIGLLIPVGMITSGALLTRFGLVKIALLSFFISYLSLFFMWQITNDAQYLSLYAFILCFGLTMGTRGPMAATLANRFFKGRSFGIIYGTIYLGSGIGGAFGAYFSGALYDITGGYDAIILFSGAAFTGGAISLLIFPKFRKRN